MSKSKQRPKTVTSLDGYRVAAMKVDAMLNHAEGALPKKKGGRYHLAAYREGYYDGLLHAHCQSVLGEFPQQNAKEIMIALSTSNLPRKKT